MAEVSQFVDDSITTDALLELSQPSLPSYPHLHDLMRRYQVKDLRGVTPEEFNARIREFLAQRGDATQAFVDPDRQESTYVQFHWGHQHDFGDFALDGRMGKHHMSMIAVFIDVMQAMPLSLEGLRVLDIGCWTGGTSLLMCAMGARVVAVEEVPMYAECVKYHKLAFGIDRLEVKGVSLFDCTTAEFQDAFDIVLCAGVLHHQSDPKLALRILFNCLKNGGTALFETTATLPESLPEICAGSTRDADPEGPPASGWNAMLFTPRNFAAMLKSVGYEVDQPGRIIRHKTPLGRLFTVARRERHVDFCRSGLSVREIR